MKVNGFDKFSSLLEKKKKQFETDIKEIVEFNVGEIEINAIRDAPGPGDQIKTQNGSEKFEDIARGRQFTAVSQSIGYKLSPDGFSGTVFVERIAGEVAAWVEFGTGQDASRYLSSTPPEWQSLARKYYINGKGTILAQPYLLPNFNKGKLEFIKDLKELLKKI